MTTLNRVVNQIVRDIEATIDDVPDVAKQRELRKVWREIVSAHLLNFARKLLPAPGQRRKK